MSDLAAFRLLSTMSAIERFAPEWEALWRQDPLAGPFQSPAWLVPWCRQFAGSDLRAVCIYRAGIFVGLLPVYLYREPSTGERRLMLLGAGTSDYLDGIFTPGCTTADICGALDWLLAQEPWDSFLASQLPLHSRLLAALAEFTGRDLQSFAGESCWRMRTGPADRFPPKIRHNVRYYRNRAARQGILEFRAQVDGDPLESFAQLQRMHSARWNQCGQPGVLQDERVLAWHREAIPLLARLGLVRFSSVSLNGEPIALHYSLTDPHSLIAPHSLIDPPWRRAPRCQYVYLTAFSTRYADLAPGTLLLASVAEHAAGEGIEVLDLLRGDEGYKKLWHLEAVATRGFSLSNSARSISGSTEDSGRTAAA